MELVYRLSLIVLAGIYLVGCGKAPSPEIGTTPEEGSTVHSRAALKYANHELRNRSEKKKYFLIAGGRDNANFSLEILEQKRFLKSLGIPDREIGCFYTIPFDKEFREDETRYRALALELSHCYPAHPKYVWEQMSDGGQTNDPLYLYVTSHGSLPLSQALKKYDFKPEDRKRIEGWLSSFPGLDQFMVSFDSLASGEPGNMWRRVEELKNGGASLEDLFFTPYFLRERIRSSWTNAAKKFVVIQACYSGGFIDSDNAEFRKNTLRGLPETTIMTAARYDRSSFGCNVGAGRTYFGGAYNDALQAGKKLPQDLDWNRLYIDVSAKVKRLETDYVSGLSMDQKIKFLSSEPMLHRP